MLYTDHTHTYKGSRKKIRSCLHMRSTEINPISSGSKVNNYLFSIRDYFLQFYRTILNKISILNMNLLSLKHFHDIMT